MAYCHGDPPVFGEAHRRVGFRVGIKCYTFRHFGMAFAGRAADGQKASQEQDVDLGSARLTALWSGAVTFREPNSFSSLSLRIASRSGPQQFRYCAP